jgi:hypothetical protein
MQFSLGAKSILFFIFSVIFLILLTLTAERIISAFLLVIPGLIGIVFGVLGILRKESRVWVPILGVILNALFVLFQTAVLFFAG